MKEISALLITCTENEVLNELADFCYDRPNCKGCPLKEVCNSYLKKDDTKFAALGDFLTDIRIMAQIEEK